MVKAIVEAEGIEGHEAANDAKYAWLEAAIENGYDIPQPNANANYSGQFKLRLPKSLHRELSEPVR
jgi:predicted HicB family RNase H-like nuclease